MTVRWLHLQRGAACAVRGADLVPGWNLISLPGTPLDQEHQFRDGCNVSDLRCSATGKATGSPRSARTQRTGLQSWQGSLTSMEGGYGYWIQTDQLREHRDADTGSGPGVDAPDSSGGWRVEPAGCDRREAGKAAKASPRWGRARLTTTSRASRGVSPTASRRFKNAWTKLIPEVTAQVDNESTTDDLNDTMDDPNDCGDSERQGLLGMVVRAGHAGTVRD